MKKNPIPKNESRSGTFMSLRFKVEKQLRVLLKEIVQSDEKNGPKRMIADFYLSVTSMKERNRRKLSPLLPIIKKIEAVKNISHLIPIIAKLHTIGVGVFWNIAIDQDKKKSNYYALYLMQDGLGMPDREYYLSKDRESRRVREAYLPYIETLLVLSGIPISDAKYKAKEIYDFEKILASSSMKKEDVRDPHKTYHKTSFASLKKQFPMIDWKTYFKLINTKEISSVIVMQPCFLKKVSDLLSDTPLSILKSYLYFHLINGYASTLHSPVVKHSFSFYGTTLTGTKHMKPIWRRGLSSVNAHIGELLGKLYVEKHFPKEAKIHIDELVCHIRDAYMIRIKTLEWMSPSTKKKALKKLSALTTKIGYPNRFKSYKGLRINPHTYPENVMNANIWEHHKEMRKLGKRIDRDEWFMTPQTVNAYFAPLLNDIVFPAAILQPPFFSPSYDAAFNYGSIGSVIGHEITHGFDDEGSKFDEKGNLKNWWSKEDRRRFDSLAKKVKRQYDAYRVDDGVPVNGSLTLGENIADFGGLSIAFDAYQTYLKKYGREDIDGLSPEERFFLGFATFEFENVRPELRKTLVKNDPHSPGEFRINGPLSNFEPFYATYKVSSKDFLFRKPGERVRIW